jgi:hypothetical protein
MTRIVLNDVFVNSAVRKGESCPLLWDLRDPATTAARLIPPTQMHSCANGFTPLHSQYATTPPVTALRICCDLLHYEWKISARNKQGVTVHDVLEAIHQVARAPLTVQEWEALSFKQQERVRRVFDVRWRGAVSPEKERKAGVRRVDCLLQVRLFRGHCPSCSTLITPPPPTFFPLHIPLVHSIRWPIYVVRPYL